MAQPSLASNEPPAFDRASIRDLPISAQPFNDTTAADVARLSEAIQRKWNSQNPEGRDIVLSYLLPTLAATDPIAAAQLIEKIPTEAGRRELLRCLANAWAAKDSVTALSWAEQLRDSDERRETLIDVTRQMAEANPAAAIAAAERFKLGEGDGEVMENLATAWAAKDLRGVLEWAGLQPEDERKDRMIAHIAFAASQTAPVEAIDLVLNQMPPGPAQDEAAISVLNQWATRDFASATGWVNRFPNGPLRDRAITELTEIKAHFDARGGR